MPTSASGSPVPPPAGPPPPLPFRTTTPPASTTSALKVRSCGCGNVEVYLPDGSDLNEGAWIDGDALFLKHEELTAYKSSPATHRARSLSQSHSRSRSISGRSKSPNTRSPLPSLAGSALGGSAVAEDDAPPPEKEDEHKGKILVCLVCGQDVLEILAQEDGPDAKPGRKVKLMLKEAQPAGETVVSPLYGLRLPPSSKPSTFGLPPSLSPAPAPASYLPALPDPFFLPPPFTPSHAYFSGLAQLSMEKLQAFRNEREEAIRAFVNAKKAEVERYEEEVRREVEALWAAYERAGGLRGLDLDGGLGLRSSRPSISVGAGAGDGSRKSSFAPPAGMNGGSDGPAGPGTPSSTGTFLHSVSLARNAGSPTSSSGTGNRTNPTSPIASGFGQGVSSYGAAGMSQSLAGPSLLSASLSQNNFLPHSLANQPIYFPHSPSGRSPRPSLNNPVTAPYRAPRSGVDLDLASSMKVSHMPPDASRFIDPHGDPSLANPDPSVLDIVQEEEEFVLNPFGESTNVSERSSYQDHILTEEERTPRTRTIKHLSSSQNGGGLGLSVGQDANGESAFAKEEGMAQQGEEHGHGHKKRVTFDHATVEKDDRKVEGEEKAVAAEGEDGAGQDEEPGVAIPDDNVFEFEDHDVPIEEQLGRSSSLTDNSPINPITSPPTNSAAPTAHGLRLSGVSSATPEQLKTLRDETNLVERKLVELHAADTPSHRAAWRNNKSGLWQALGGGNVRPGSGVSSPANSKSRSRSGSGSGSRRSSKDGKRSDRVVHEEPEEENEDEMPPSSIYASSMPIRIAFPQSKKGSMDLEPKTSLTDRHGVLVPPLRAAMRQSSGAGFSTGLPAAPTSDSTRPQRIPETAAEEARRSSSTGRDNQPSDRGRSSSAAYSLRDRDSFFPKDPGPALEAMDEQGDVAVDPEDVVGGASFVPPHRLTERKPSEPGWRSMVERE